MIQKGFVKIFIIILMLVALLAVGYLVFFPKSKKTIQQPASSPALNQTQDTTKRPVASSAVSSKTQETNQPAEIVKSEMDNWLSFSSSYFTLSFKVPTGFEVKDSQNRILVAKSPYYTREIGDDNAFFSLIRYNKYDTRTSKLASYRKLLKNLQESTVVVDGSSFLLLKGDDWGRFAGDSAGEVEVIFFDASWLEIIERPANSNQKFNPIEISNQILSTFKFSK